MEKISQVWAVYFTGTGNTKKTVQQVAKAAAAKLGCECKDYDFSLPKVREQELAFAPTDLVVIGTPVYAGRVPNVLLPYLTGKITGNGALAIPVVTYGNRNFDDGLMELRNIMHSNGLHPVAGGAFVGEHSFSVTLGAGRPDTADMSLAAQLGEQAADKILSLSAVPAQPVAVEGEDPIRPYYTPRDRNGTPINILKVKPKTDTDKCINCGLCARICTMGSIDPQNVASVTGICIKCCACVKRCPKGAKYYDDEGYLYHQHELEDVYARPAESKIFL
ncbi:MAG: EFR1 family ferrodoxin [Oscillospiraceae bacterium]|nr:EFR1 family ferrodoxin [Oscillospiraceae bacterium]